MRDYIYLLMTDRVGGPVASLSKFFLYLLSFLYGLAIKIMVFLRRNGTLPTMHLEAKVISVGNITLGGTGKTPLVELVARIFVDRGKKVSILTRGYKIPAKGNREEIGDEPALLRMKLPQVNVLVGPDRVKTGQAAIYTYGADVLVLDDGFQYWSLSRDVDILAIDTTNPFGNGCLLPRGILREPVGDIVRASVVVMTKTDLAGPQEVDALKRKIKSINPDAFVFASVHKPVKFLEFASFEKLQTAASQNIELPLESIKGKDIVALCGIGNPDYFIKTLEKLGAAVKAQILFQDHHPYDFTDLEYVSKKCQDASTSMIVTTEKDMIKLKPLIQRHALAFESLQIKFSALEIRLEILQDEDKFAELIWR